MVALARCLVDSGRILWTRLPDRAARGSPPRGRSRHSGPLAVGPGRSYLPRHAGRRQAGL